MLQCGLAFSPQQKLFGEQLLSDSPPSVVLEQELDTPYTDFCVGWLAEHWSGGCQTCQSCSYNPVGCTMQMLSEVTSDAQVCNYETSAL